MRDPASPVAPNEDALRLWYDLSRLYSRAASTGGRSSRLGFTVTLVSGAFVLLSAPLFGTDWAGPFAPVIPLILGLAVGLAKFAVERAGMRRTEAAISAALSDLGYDASRPGSGGLAAYYDAQLILLRAEYEYLLRKNAGRSARTFEDTFGFTPEDDFEVAPLSVAADTNEMADLRRRWENRVSAGTNPAPQVGLKEDRAYRFYPREMTVGAERVVREAYLTVSLDLAARDYGRGFSGAPKKLRPKIEREAEEYRRLTGKKRIS